MVSDRLFQKIKDFFQAVGWKVVILKHGRRQEAAFAKPGGEALRQWIDDCPNELYCALTFKGRHCVARAAHPGYRPHSGHEDSAGRL